MKLVDIIKESKIIGKLPPANEVYVGYIFLKDYKNFSKGTTISYRGTHVDQHLFELLKSIKISEEEFNKLFSLHIITGGFVNSKGRFFTNTKDIIRENKEALKAEYNKLKNLSFQNANSIKRMEEIYRELLHKYDYEIDPEVFNKKMNTNKKFRKSQRVTNFTRDRR